MRLIAHLHQSLSDFPPMRHILTSVVLVVFLFPSLASGETMEDLVEREGIHYNKLSDVPFTGEVTGKNQGFFERGLRYGPWVRYHDNGQLWSEGTWKDGKQDGPKVVYYANGQLRSEGTYKDGKKDGPWVRYHRDGTVNDELTGTFKDGVKVE
jgi:antitoxin component YwqK of YwqJK toxin-antitoxin module